MNSPPVTRSIAVAVALSVLAAVSAFCRRLDARRERARQRAAAEEAARIVRRHEAERVAAEDQAIMLTRPSSRTFADWCALKADLEYLVALDPARIVPAITGEGEITHD